MTYLFNVTIANGNLWRIKINMLVMCFQYSDNTKFVPAKLWLCKNQMKEATLIACADLIKFSPASEC